MRDNLLGLARFASQVDWADFASEPIGNNILSDRRFILRAGCSDGETAIFWLLLDTNNDPDLTFEDGAYTVEFWEMYGGNRLTATDGTVEGGSLRLTLDAEIVPGALPA